MRTRLRGARSAAALLIVLGLAAASAPAASAAPSPPRLPILNKLPGRRRQGNIVVNGGFERPVEPTTGGFFFYAGGAATIPGWVVAASPLDIATQTPSVDIDRGTWQMIQGAQSVDLNGKAPGALYQDLRTTPGKHYRLRYAMAGNLTCGPTVKTMRVKWGGAVVQAPAFDTTGHSTSSMGWTFHTVSVMASGYRTRLAFVSTTPGGCGPELDAVSVRPARARIPVPIPTPVPFGQP